MMFFFVVGAIIFALLFILVGYFIGNYEGKRVYRELLCYRQSVIDQLRGRELELINQLESASTATYGCDTGATVANITRWMQASIHVHEYNYYVKLLRKVGSALMRTPLRTEHVHSDYQRKQQDVPAFWP